MRSQITEKPGTDVDNTGPSIYSLMVRTAVKAGGVTTDHSKPALRSGR